MSGARCCMHSRPSGKSGLTYPQQFVPSDFFDWFITPLFGWSGVPFSGRCEMSCLYMIIHHAEEEPKPLQGYL
jgi:hypothetical protein